MKPLLPLLLFLPSLLAAPMNNRDLQLAAVNFERAYSPWVHRLFGCSSDISPVDIAHCSSGRGYVDYGAFKRAREEAKRMFQLHD